MKTLEALREEKEKLEKVVKEKHEVDELKKEVLNLQIEASGFGKFFRFLKKQHKQMKEKAAENFGENDGREKKD
jgi:uncharacterized coiled-coil DUF342 family protein